MTHQPRQPHNQATFLDRMQRDMAGRQTRLEVSKSWEPEPSMDSKLDNLNLSSRQSQQDGGHDVLDKDWCGVQKIKKAVRQEEPQSQPATGKPAADAETVAAAVLRVVGVHIKDLVSGKVPLQRLAILTGISTGKLLSTSTVLISVNVEQ